MFSTRTGRPVTRASDSEVRSTWPPPSPAAPSIRIVSLVLLSIVSLVGSSLRLSP
jgi:hypothetical protein